MEEDNFYWSFQKTGGGKEVDEEGRDVWYVTGKFVKIVIKAENHKNNIKKTNE